MKDLIYQYQPQIGTAYNTNSVQKQLTYYEKFKKEYDWESRLSDMLSQKDLDSSQQYSQNYQLSCLRNYNPNFVNTQQHSLQQFEQQKNYHIKQKSKQELDFEDIKKMNVKMKKKLDVDRLKIENQNRSFSSLEIKTHSPQKKFKDNLIRGDYKSLQDSSQQKLLNENQIYHQKFLTEKKGKSLSNKKLNRINQNYNSNQKAEQSNQESIDTSYFIDKCQSGLQELQAQVQTGDNQQLIQQFQQNFNFLKKSIINQSQFYSEVSEKQKSNEMHQLVQDIYQLCVMDRTENQGELTQLQQLQKIQNYILQNPKEFSFKALPKSLHDNQTQTVNDKFEETKNKLNTQIIDDKNQEIKNLQIQLKEIKNAKKQLESQVKQQEEKVKQIQEQNFDHQQKFLQISNEKNKLIKLNQELVQQLQQNEETVFQQHQKYQVREEHFQKQINFLQTEKEELVQEYNKLKQKKVLQNEDSQKDEEKSNYDLQSEQINRSGVSFKEKLNKSENFQKEISQETEEEEDQNSEEMEQIVLQLITANKNLNIKFDKDKKILQEKINKLQNENNELKIQLQKNIIDNKVHKFIQKERDEYKQKLEEFQSGKKKSNEDNNVYEKENKLLFNEMMDQKNLYEQTLQEKTILEQNYQELQNENLIMKKLIDNFEKRLDSANQTSNYQEQLKETLLKLQKSLEMNQHMKKKLEELQDYEQKYKQNKNEIQGLKEDLQNRKEIEKILKEEIKDLKKSQKNQESDQEQDIVYQEFKTEDENQFPFLNINKDYDFTNSEISQEIYNTKNSNQEKISNLVENTEEDEDHRTSIDSQNDQDSEVLQQQVLIQETEQNFQDLEDQDKKQNITNEKIDQILIQLSTSTH